MVTKYRKLLRIDQVSHIAIILLITIRFPDSIYKGPALQTSGCWIFFNDLTFPPCAVRITAVIIKPLIL